MSDTLYLKRREFFEPDEESTDAVRPFHLPEVKSADGVLIVFADNPKALQFELINSVIIGRRSESGAQPDVDLAPFGGFPAGVSRLHARLTRTPHGVLLEDLGSRNGTYLNGERLERGKEVLVTSGQSLGLADLYGWVYFGGSSSGGER